ncbi:MAG: DNA repair protein RecO [Candidatus Cloacimonetes bacterium]|nr:DNA repair protein RecO [Candidatus Cloacimonadota bacterium]
MKGKIKTLAIVLRTTRFSESSLVIHAFSEMLGTISILAKGIRKKPEYTNLQRLNELEFVLYEPVEGGMYLYAEGALIRELTKTDDAMNRACAESGAELVAALIISPEELKDIYRLLVTYLEYVKNVERNTLAIFWRFMLRITRELGVPLELRTCGHCHRQGIKPSGYEEQNGFPLCEQCLGEIYNVHGFSPQARRLLFHLPEIGNYLSEFQISSSMAEEVNGFLFRYLEHRFHKHISLQSVHVVLQLLRLDQNGSN